MDLFEKEKFDVVVNFAAESHCGYLLESKKCRLLRSDTVEYRLLVTTPFSTAQGILNETHTSTDSSMHLAQKIIKNDVVILF